MQDKENITVIYPLSINFNTFKQYDLSISCIDEIVFFEWLVVKRLSFGSDEFFYQNHRVISELGIKRHRLEKIKKQFISYGLEIELKGFTNTSNYMITEKFIRKFVKIHLEKPYQKGTLKQLLNLDFKNEVKVTATDKRRIKEFIVKLEKLYNHRRKRKVEYTQGKELLEDSGLSHNNKTYQQFKLLMGKYPNRDVIEGSFVCYVDKLIKGEDRTLHILNNFSSYNRANDSFPIFESRLNEYNNNYSIQN